MAQWYAQLLFQGDTLIGEGLADLGEVTGIVAADDAPYTRYTTVVISGYALYGQLRGYYALGVAQMMVDPTNGRAAYASQASALHNEPVESLTPAQRAAVRQWLVELNPAAWENSTESLRKSLE